MVNKSTEELRQAAKAKAAQEQAELGDLKGDGLYGEAGLGETK